MGRTEARIGVGNAPVEREGRHERPPLAKARRQGPLPLLELQDRPAAVQLLGVVVALLADFLQDETRGVALRVSADRSGPATVMPWHADRDVTKRQLIHAWGFSATTPKQ